MSESHKLAVILFADIAGYTALMEEDEANALAALSRFKEVVEKEALAHQGQIVQYFGDGALLAFDSSSGAVACGAAMQTTFQATPEVPVRIGMHLGDVLFKNGNAFGNGVNIASRIESLGVPGSVLMSKPIRNQIKNKGTYQLASLGEFAFKNVDEPMEVYALANPGFVVPRKSEMQGKLKQAVPARFGMKFILPVLALLIFGSIYWGYTAQDAEAKTLLPDEVRNEKVAVAVFNNFTNNSELDALGNMASDWLSFGLRELGVKTSSPEMMRKYKDQVGVIPGNAKGEVSLFELTDAQYVVIGSFYQKGDSIQLSSRLESTINGDNVYDFPTIWGHSSKKEELVAEIREQLKGYWTVREDKRLSTVNPPKYEAYQRFLGCWLFDQPCHISVLEIDSTFLLARIYMAYAAHPIEHDSLYHASKAYVKQHWDRCTAFEKNFFHFLENREKGNPEAALAAIRRNLELDPKNLDVVHYVAYSYLLHNQPMQTVETLKPFFDQYEVFKDQIVGNSYNAYFFALNRVGMHKQIITYAQQEAFPDWVPHSREVSKALILDGNIEALRNRLDSILPAEALRLAHYFNTLRPEAENIFAPAVRANLDTYADPVKSWDYLIWSNYHLYNWDSKAYAYYQLKEWEKAEKILLGLRDIDWETYANGTIPPTVLPGQNWHMNLWLEGLLGATYARQAKTAQAHQQIEKLDSMRASFPGSLMRMHKGTLSYWQARIHAVLGEKEQAVAYLAQSLEEGHRIEFDNFVFDWDLAGLTGYAPYEDLVKPR